MRLMRLVALAAPLLMSAASPATLPDARFVEWTRGQPARHLVADNGTTIDIGEATCGTQPLGHPGCFGDADADARYLTAVIRSRDGAPPLRITSALGIRFRIGVGRLSAGDPHPSLVILTGDGGSGGCVSFQIAYAEPKGFGLAELDHGAGPGSSTFCRQDGDRIAFPELRGGQRGAAFHLADDAFDCAFQSCASSWAPPRIVAFDHGISRDVSDDIVYRPLFAADAALARAACERPGGEPQSACVAYVADSSRIDRGAEAMAVLQRRTGTVPETHCESFAQPVTPSGTPGRCLAETRYASFADHAEAFLQRAGYRISAPR